MEGNGQPPQPPRPPQRPGGHESSVRPAAPGPPPLPNPAAPHAPPMPAPTAPAPPTNAPPNAPAAPPPIPDQPRHQVPNFDTAPPGTVGPPAATFQTSGQVDYRSYNEENELTTRPCENCGGQLRFNIEHQQLGCTSCGHLQDITHHEDAEVQEQDFQAMMVAARSHKNERLHHAEGEKEVICQNCGGHTTFVGTLTTTKCPYCATDLARTDIHEAPDRLAVDGVLPFAITGAIAEDKLKEWVNKRWFAPNEYKKYSTSGSFQSIYAAYFTYDADVTTDYDGARGTTRTRTVGSGQNRRTETYTTWQNVHGSVFDQFDDVTVLANTGFNQAYVHKLEPWPTRGLEPYNPDYIAGHLCRTYDLDAKDCFSDAHRQMKSEVEHTVRRSIGGDQQRIQRMNMQMANLTYKHVLLPIWLLTVLYNGQAMQVFMNGTTGEIHGERPWSKVKIIAAVIAVLLLIILILVIRSATGSQ